MTGKHPRAEMGEVLTGKQLGKYRIRSVIGRGGMGRVYEAYDPALDRSVALKVMAPHLTWEEEFVERFLREARAAARLRHPNIVTIYDVGSIGGWHYFTMDYVRGRTVAQIIEERGPMSIGEAVRVLRPLASALDYAHARGLVHRDVKPSNVAVGDGGEVTLMDFGIARASGGTRLTRSGAVLGTPEYMAPEQARGDEVDRYTDQYALGVVAFEMLTGRAPFKAESTPTLLYKIVHESPPPLRSVRPDLPEGATGVLARALAKEKARRYGSCSEFAEALQQATRTTALEAPPRHAPRPVEEGEGGRSQKGVLLGLGGVGLLVVGLLCLLVAGAGIVLGLVAIGGREGAPPTATRLPTAAPATRTVSGAVQPTATSPRPSATPPPTETPGLSGGGVLYQDDFDGPWSSWESGDYEGGSVGLKDGRYSVLSAGDLQWMWGVGNLYFTDLVIEVDAIQILAGPNNDNDYGVACRVQPNGDGYHLIISGDGYYAIYVRESGVFVALEDFQPSDVIRQGNATNRIRVVCDGPFLALSVNGRELARAEDYTFVGGDIALTATSYEDAPTEILFDNLVVYDVEG